MRNLALPSRFVFRPARAALLPVLVAMAAGFGAMGSAHAQAMRDGMGVYVQGGGSIHGNSTRDLFVGVTGPWIDARPWGGGAMSVYWDAFLGQWHSRPRAGGSQTMTQIGIIPTARFRFDGGNSRWFADAGLGLTYMDEIYHGADRDASTRFEFTERIALGRNFGAMGEHELSLNYQHFSNAGIKKPNPGEDFVQVRYAYKF